MPLPPAIVIGLMAVGLGAGSLAHEIGHFTVAGALGLHPRLLKVGRGRSVVHFSIGKARVHIQALPLGGGTRAGGASAGGSRSRVGRKA